MDETYRWQVGNNGMLWLGAGLVIANIFWGASGVAVKEAYGQLSTIEVVTLRFVLATPLLVAATLLLKGRGALAIDVKDIPYMALLATVGISAALLLQAWSLDQTTVTNFTLITGLSTFAVMLLSFAMARERPTKDKLLGAVVAFLGLAVRDRAVEIYFLSVFNPSIVSRATARAFPADIVMAIAVASAISSAVAPASNARL